MQSFEERYQAYLDLVRDNTPTLEELDSIHRQVRRLNHDLEYATLDPDHRLALIKLRNETMTAVEAALHRARIDDARAVMRAVAAGRATPEERRRYAAQRKNTSIPAPGTAMPTPPKQSQKRDRGISR
ncbi:hypothetical protein [Nocardia sp. SC052]|uniref:hypothetical protein n=1 Tax=Nocardia sichangensis TaxID=3385975 RepID=UPI0039A1AE31